MERSTSIFLLRRTVSANVAVFGPKMRTHDDTFALICQLMVTFSCYRVVPNSQKLDNAIHQMAANNFERVDLTNLHTHTSAESSSILPIILHQFESLFSIIWFKDLLHSTHRAPYMSLANSPKMNVCRSLCSVVIEHIKSMWVCMRAPIHRHFAVVCTTRTDRTCTSTSQS